MAYDRKARHDDTTRTVTGYALQQRRRRWFSLHPLCVRCEARGETALATQLDHIVPLFKGGEENDPTNWQGLCEPCHVDKTNEDMGHRVRHETGGDGWPV